MRDTSDRHHAGHDPLGRSCPDAPEPEVHAAEWAPLLGELRHVDQRWVRHINRALVCACIREHGPLSRVEIVARTDLSRASVSAITNALLREGVIREGERLPSSTRGGRPAVLLHAIARRGGVSEAPTQER
jgi:hypothetical protein